MTTSITLLHYVVTNSNKYLLLTHVDTGQEKEKRMKITIRRGKRKGKNYFPLLSDIFKTRLARYTYTPHAIEDCKSGIPMQSKTTVKCKNINELCGIPVGIPTTAETDSFAFKINTLASIPCF